MVVATGRDGTSLPTQCEALAFWPDQSVKWMLVTVLLQRETEQINLKPVAAVGQPSTSRPAGTQRPTPYMRIDRADNGYQVNTGPLRFRIGTDTAGFLADAMLTTPDGKSIPLLRAGPHRLWRLDYYVTDEPGRSPVNAILPAGTLDTSRLQINRIELERSGPLWATFVLRGKYLHDRLGRSLPARPDTPSQVDIRIHAFAGQSYVVVEHTFVYEGNPEADFLCQCGLRLPLDLKGDKGKRVTAAAGQERIERWMYADPLLAADSPGKPGEGSSLPHWRQGAVVQDSYDHYRTYKLAAPAGRPVVVDEAARSPGWIDIGDNEWGCAVGIVGMAENYPTALDASNEDAAVTAWLYPPQVPPADLRRYTPAANDAQAGQATGISKTHRLWVYFHTGREEQAQVAEVAGNLWRRVLLKLDPKQTADSGVLGPYRWSDPVAFPKMEKLAGDVTDFLLAHQEHFRWFGIFDYGDWQGVYRFRDSRNPADNLRWMNDWGRWGWNNDEGLASLWLLWQYLRTGEARYFDAGCAMVAHVRDIDVIHTKAYPSGPARGPYEYRDMRGFGHRHNVEHWGDGYIGPRVANPIAWRLEYYLTGDGRTKDCIDEVYQANVTEDKVWTYCDSVPTALYALYAKYEMTGQEEYRKKIEAFLDKYCDHAIASGCFPVETPWDFATGQAKGPFKGSSIGSFFWHSYGMANFLIEWQALTGSDKVRRALVRQAEATLRDNSRESSYSHFQILSAGYRLTGDRVYLQRMGELLRQSTGDAPLVPADRTRWFGAEAYMRPKTVGMIGFLMSGLPYAEGAVSDEGVLWSGVAATQPAGGR